MSKQTQYEPLHNPWVFSGLMATSQSQAPRNMAVFMACSTWASPDLTDAILLSTWHNKGHSHHLAWKGLDWHIIYIFSTIHLKKVTFAVSLLHKNQTPFSITSSNCWSHIQSSTGMYEVDTPRMSHQWLGEFSDFNNVGSWKDSSTKLPSFSGHVTRHMATS